MNFDNGFALHHLLATVYTVWPNFVYESSLPRSPPHPFITVLTSSPEQATVLIQQVNLLLVNSININRYKAPHHISSF